MTVIIEIPDEKISSGVFQNFITNSWVCTPLSSESVPSISEMRLISSSNRQLILFQRKSIFVCGKDEMLIIIIIVAFASIWVLYKLSFYTFIYKVLSFIGIVDIILVLDDVVFYIHASYCIWVIMNLLHSL